MLTTRGRCWQHAKGKCIYGLRCKFSHDGPGGENDNRAGHARGAHSSRGASRGGRHGGGYTSAATSGESSGFRFSRSYWDQQLSHLNAAPLDQALAVLNGGPPEQIQDFIIALGDEAGLRWIRTLSAGRPVGGLGFDSYVAPFLLVITHQQLLSSLALERQRYSIYSVLYGIHGKNGHDFFTTVITKFNALEVSEASAALFSSTCKALLQTLRSNQEASVTPTFDATSLFDRLCAIAGVFRTANNDAVVYHTRVADQMFAKIRQYLNLGEAIPEASVAITRARNLLEPVPQPLVDLPGELSEKGPRHNNDFHNIELISILPTSDELNSDRPDFLPKRGDSAVHYEQGVKRLLDEQFRLLREDTVGVLRDAVRGVVSDWNTILGGTAKARASALRRLQTKCIIYPAAFLEKCTVDKRDGLVVLMSFAQPHQLAQKTHAARKKFWKEDNGHSLQRGNIVALVEGRTQSTVFLLVSDRTVIERTREAEDDAKDLASHPSRAFIELKLVNPTSTDDQIRLLSVVRCVPGDAILVEFPGLLFASFEPVLKGLQTLHRSADVPFVDYIVPHTYEFRAQDHLVASGGAIDVPPPLYLSRSPDLILDLSCITVNKHPLAHSVNQPVTIAQLRAHTTLDPGQCQAFIHALSSELALLQGPPGTGKSYIGVQIVKVLLANKRALDLGPVICVGYTNHALDQFVEHLLDSGITNMVRMGSRSQSERLQKCTLQSFEKTKTMGEKRLAAICYSKMDGLVDELRIGLTHIAKPITAVNIGFHLEQTTPWTPYHSVLFPSDGPDKEGFTVASGRSKHSEYKFWSAGRDSRGRPARITSDRALDEIVRFLQYAPSGLWDLSLAERKTLINQWEEEIILSRQNRIRRAVAELTECQQDLKAHHLESDKRALENVDIIGITTTGLATNSRLLRSLNSKLVICEEAAEILEAHTITALLPNLEHAVLIGDHLQLRPKISDYKLSLESPGGSMYALDQSLFERLALGSGVSPNEARMQVASLDVQRRMHPRERLP